MRPATSREISPRQFSQRNRPSLGSHEQALLLRPMRTNLISLSVSFVGCLVGFSSHKAMILKRFVTVMNRSSCKRAGEKKYA